MSKQFFRLTFWLLFSLIILALSLESIWQAVEPDEQNIPLPLLFQSKEFSGDDFYKVVPTDSLHWSGPLLTALSEGQVIHLENSQGEAFYYKKLAQDVQVVGPIIYPKLNELNSNVFSLLFYSGFVIILILWFRPVFVDFSRLSRSIKIFSRTANWHEVELKETSIAFPMATTINAMAARIGQLIELQKSLSRMIGHEIRTPLARTQFSIASLKYEPSLEELLSIEEDIEEIAQLTEEFLKITKLEFESKDLVLSSQYTKGILYNLSTRLSSQSRIKISTIVDEKFKARIDGETFKRLAQNLITNALKHAESKITVRMFILDNCYHLSISDDGKGFESYQEVNKPFQQDNKNLDGYGLGLSIVKMIAGWYGGDIVLTSSEELGGAKVVFNWPMLIHDEKSLT